MKFRYLEYLEGTKSTEFGGHLIGIPTLKGHNMQHSGHAGQNLSS